jgi:hypothetical protein
MHTPVIREEAQAFMQACQAFSEFSRYNDLTPVEREAIGNFVQALGLVLNSEIRHHTVTIPSRNYPVCLI